MDPSSVWPGLLRPRTKKEPTAPGRQQRILLPRTAADELPPYREQPWVIDRAGCSVEGAEAGTRFGAPRPTVAPLPEPCRLGLDFLVAGALGAAPFSSRSRRRP